MHLVNVECAYFNIKCYLQGISVCLVQCVYDFYFFLPLQGYQPVFCFTSAGVACQISAACVSPLPFFFFTPFFLLNNMHTVPAPASMWT